MQPVINATGVLLHTNLGRAPLAARAVERMTQVTRYANLELDLTTGRRSGRGQRAVRLMSQLCGAEDAVIVNNCAAATMLVLQAIAGGREVIISRGQLVEIGGGFRLPEVFQAAGVKLCEVGTTNRTYLNDYEKAIGDQTGAILRVHHSNFSQTGFVTEPSIDELVAARTEQNHVVIIDDLGSGCFQDLSPLGFQEPLVTHSVTAGADLTLFSGDKLFGGPQCGVVVGRRELIGKLRSCPVMRAVRVDKLTLAALEATTEIHLAERAAEELPLTRMMFRSPESVRQDAMRMVDQLSDCDRLRMEVVACDSQIGGGAIPGAALPSFAIRLSGGDINQIAQQLRTGTPAVQGRVAQDALLLDLRTVDDDEQALLLDRLRATLETVERSA